ncbi:MAG: IS1 family transposase [Acidobacteria bacterium]|nr:MAG: IS1 family transposase [Acidobacteriota bacterium]
MIVTAFSAEIKRRKAMTCVRCQHQTCKRFGYFGKRRVQRWRCNSCRGTFCEPAPKIGTHYTAPDTAAKVLTLMLEGMSVRAISRVTGLHKNTILSLLETAGANCHRLWDRHMRGLRTQFVQADEIWTFCGCHERRLKPGAPAEWGDQYVWFALDSVTKMVLSYHIGRREGAGAQAFIKDLSERVDGRFQLTTDGLRWYVPAVDEHLGGNCDYSQLIKLYSSHDITGPEWYGAASRVTGTIPRIHNGRPDPRYISTSHIERSNLTLRMQLRRFTRLTNAHSRKLENLQHAVTLYMAWYNFCRVHATLRVTPAMEAGLTDHVWMIAELLGAN